FNRLGRIMWLKTKPKNRRFERAHVLDVKLRSEHSRAARLRLVSSALGILLGTICGLFLLWQGSSIAMRVLLYENDAFAIRVIDISTDGALPVEEIRQWAGVKLGDNLLALDLPRIKRDLELVPWIQEVAVERLLPNSLILSVTEREAIAQVYSWEPGAVVAP